jgi:hypothetical protein
MERGSERGRERIAMHGSLPLSEHQTPTTTLARSSEAGACPVRISPPHPSWKVTNRRSRSLCTPRRKVRARVSRQRSGYRRWRSRKISAAVSSGRASSQPASHLLPDTFKGIFTCQPIMRPSCSARPFFPLFFEQRRRCMGKPINRDLFLSTLAHRELKGSERFRLF